MSGRIKRGGERERGGREGGRTYGFTELHSLPVDLSHSEHCCTLEERVEESRVSFLSQRCGLGRLRSGLTSWKEGRRRKRRAHRDRHTTQHDHRLELVEQPLNSC